MIRLLLLLCAALLCGTAAAHGTADNHLQIMIADNRVKMNITVDMRVLGAVDDDGDGAASLAELAAHRDDFQAWLSESLIIADGDGKRGSIVFADVTSDLNIAREHGDRVEYARILQTLLFDGAPEVLQVNVAPLASLVPELRVTVIDAATGLSFKLRDPARPQTVVMPAS